MSNSVTIRGALIEATLPVVIRTTWVNPFVRSSSATNLLTMRLAAIIKRASSYLLMPVGLSSGVAEVRNKRRVPG